MDPLSCRFTVWTRSAADSLCGPAHLQIHYVDPAEVTVSWEQFSRFHPHHSLERLKWERVVSVMQYRRVGPVNLAGVRVQQR